MTDPKDMICPKCGSIMTRRIRPDGYYRKDCPSCIAFNTQVHTYRRLTDAEIDERERKSLETFERTKRVIAKVRKERE
jgi:hypothetical protein